MNFRLAAAISRATRAVRANNLLEGMRRIQEAVSRPEPDKRQAPRPAPRPAGPIDSSVGPARRQPTQRQRRPLPEVLGILNRGLAGDAFRSLPGGKRVVPAPIPEGAEFAERRFSCDAGTRTYKVYIPASVRNGRKASGLIVMLHGCKQDPDDFATGTKMNAEGETHDLIVAYPCQPSSANPSSCWNWFNPADQSRGAGEPAILAGLTRALSSEFGLDRENVYVAGLSAGGAMAAVMGATYPDLYSAVGVHSGLAHRAANDVVTAFAAMRGDLSANQAISRSRATSESPLLRTIVFHGSADRTVHPRNGDVIISATAAFDAGPVVEDRGSAHGRSYVRTTFAGSGEKPAVEHWLIQDSGHAWCGGDPNGSFADGLGPNASAEMVRFFLASRGC